MGAVDKNPRPLSSRAPRASSSRRIRSLMQSSKGTLASRMSTKRASMRGICFGDFENSVCSKQPAAAHTVRQLLPCARGRNAGWHGRERKTGMPAHGPLWHRSRGAGQFHRAPAQLPRALGLDARGRQVRARMREHTGGLTSSPPVAPPNGAQAERPVGQARLERHRFERSM